MIWIAKKKIFFCMLQPGGVIFHFSDLDPKRLGTNIDASRRFMAEAYIMC